MYFKQKYKSEKKCLFIEKIHLDDTLICVKMANLQSTNKNMATRNY